MKQQPITFVPQIDANMRIGLLIACSLCLTVSVNLQAQKLKKADLKVVNQLQSHVQYLASDELAGRRAGTAGEEKAKQYISQAFAGIGLSPKGTEGYFQSFPIYDGKAVDASTFFIVDGHELQLNKEFFPLAISNNGQTQAAVSVALKEAGVPWFWDLKEFVEGPGFHPHVNFTELIANKANEFAKQGATALVVINSSNKVKDVLQFNPKEKWSSTLPIPIVAITNQATATYFKDVTNTHDVQLKVQLADAQRTGNNVIGFIDNGAPLTAIVGAHFDHLGYGEDGNSMLRTGEKLIHNGADDNASGTAALIEVARQMKTKGAKNMNYLFIAFSAEELGLFGSKYFTEHPTVDLAKVSYMINMDMVGRLNDSSKVITLGGVGTSPEWQALTTVPNRYLTFKYDSSGTGPSDHSSFYRKDIPVLFYFTGLHTDYHKPSDDADKINYKGQYFVVQHVTSVLNAYATKQKLPFTKTREQQTTTSARFSVSMGIMPDYSFAGNGVRVDGVTDGRPAQKAGIKAGDIIIQLGEVNTVSVEQYMQALSKFKKGDATTVKYKRGEEEKTANIQF